MKTQIALFFDFNLERVKVAKSARCGHYLKLLWAIGEAQHALQTGHFSRSRGQGEALQEAGKEKEQLHSGQVLP